MSDENDSWVKVLRYRLINRLIHQPRLLRMLGAWVRRKPSLAHLANLVADRDSVAKVFGRVWNFSTSQAGNMRAGEFVIGMDSGERQREERAFLERVLLPPARFGDEAATASKQLITQWQQRGAGRFDLVNDYMVHVAWRPLARVLGAAGDQIASGDPADLAAFFSELRAVGSQLIIGSVAPHEVRARADTCAARLNRRIDAAAPLLDSRWTPPTHWSQASVLRNAVGLMWVGHPATVQAGALCMQELMGRPAEFDKLASRVRQAGDAAWTDPELREVLQKHVLELLRLRPPFPILSRNVPRDAWFAVGKDFPPGRVTAGSDMIMLVIGALADAAGKDGESYRPGRVLDNEDKMMMFGRGERRCIARDHVVDVLVSALAGLLLLDKLRWGSRIRRIRYDGPTISSMPLRYGT